MKNFNIFILSRTINNWNFFNFLLQKVGKLNSFELGCNKSNDLIDYFNIYNILKLKNSFFFLNEIDDNFLLQYKDNFKDLNNFIIYKSSNMIIQQDIANLILPSFHYFEKTFFSLNLEGSLKKINKVLNLEKNINFLKDSDIFNILNKMYLKYLSFCFSNFNFFFINFFFINFFFIIKIFFNYKIYSTKLLILCDDNFLVKFNNFLNFKLINLNIFSYLTNYYNSCFFSKLSKNMILNYLNNLILYKNIFLL